MADSVTNATIGERLLAAGWRQGVCLSALGHGYVEVPPDAEQVPQWTMSRGESAHQLVVVTQTCDLVKPASKEPYVDTMRAYVVKDLPARNSYRYFVLDRNRRLVADAAYRTQVLKESLTRTTPMPGLSDERGQAIWFAQWIAGRYNREAFPDSLVECVIKPIQATIRSMARFKDSETNAALADAEVRILDPVGGPPYNVSLLILSHRELTPELRAAVGKVVDQLSKCFKSSDAALEECPIVTASEISLAEYLSTREIDLDEVSFRGDVLTAQEQERRAEAPDK